MMCASTTAPPVKLATQLCHLPVSVYFHCHQQPRVLGR